MGPYEARSRRVEKGEAGKRVDQRERHMKDRNPLHCNLIKNNG